MTYKITISEVTESEVPKTEYKKLGTKNAIGEDEYGYVDTGRMEIERHEKAIYEQEKDNLDVAELAIFINRAR